MGKTIDRSGTRLYGAVDDLRDLLPLLQGMLGEPDHVGPKSGTIGRKPDGSEPWNSPAASAYFDAWYGAGDIAQDMRVALHLREHAVPPVGPAALDAILNYAPSCPDDVVGHAARRLERWADRARQLPTIDESEPWVAVPGETTPPACPFCRTFGLRMKRRRQEVRCFFPRCVDSGGHPTRARMEPGRMTGEARLVFDDDTTMHWAGDGS